MNGFPYSSSSFPFLEVSKAAEVLIIETWIPDLKTLCIQYVIQSAHRSATFFNFFNSDR